MRGLHIVETRRARALRGNASAAERQLWNRLKNRGLGGYKFTRQQPIGPYIADLVCRESKLVIELDGATHSSNDEIEGDKRRSWFLEAEGYCVIRFTNEQIFENIDAVVDAIRLSFVKDNPAP